VTTFYTAPTAIRMFMKWGSELLNGIDLSSLRLLGSVGEPLNPEAWHWYFKHIGKEKCPIVDTWWQTETGSILMSSLPGIMGMKPGRVGKALPGIEVKILDDYGYEVKKGYLAVMSPWPSMLRGIHGDTRRFVQTYWNKWGGRYYFAGDGAGIDEDGYTWISGRVDDTMNIAAHRIGTMEVESAMVEHPAIAEAAVVGVPDEITGQAIAAFVVLKKGFSPSEQLKESIKEHVVKKIGAIARPKKIFFTEDVPKTRSGKIMRRLLQDLALGRSLGDMTTLEDVKFIKNLESTIRQAKVGER
jgi:acetyl-CoA synthetase